MFLLLRDRLPLICVATSVHGPSPQDFVLGTPQATRHTQPHLGASNEHQAAVGIPRNQIAGTGLHSPGAEQSLPTMRSDPFANHATK